jgi:hypothetical protein
MVELENGCKFGSEITILPNYWRHNIVCSEDAIRIYEKKKRVQIDFDSTLHRALFNVAQNWSCSERLLSILQVLELVDYRGCCTEKGLQLLQKLQHEGPKGKKKDMIITTTLLKIPNSFVPWGPIITFLIEQGLVTRTGRQQPSLLPKAEEWLKEKVPQLWSQLISEIPNYSYEGIKFVLSFLPLGYLNELLTSRHEEFRKLARERINELREQGGGK